MVPTKEIDSDKKDSIAS